MDDTKNTPKVFANRLIRMLVDNTMSPDRQITYKDYQVIRTAFRSLGGSWELLSNGDHKQLGTLREVITSWSNQPQQQTSQAFI